MDYPFEYKKGMTISILGACNGLICFGIVIDTKTSICIWNPTTREYRKIHHSNFHNDPKVYCDSGFGYDSKTGDYKMVTIADSKRSGYCEVEVYTFGLHLSKTILTFPHKYPIHAPRVVFLNGALHWISSSTSKQDIYHGILTFDISNEKLMDVPLPEKCILHPEDSKTELHKTIGVLGDCLSLVLVDVKTVEIWVMQDYGVRESWTKLFTTTQEPIIHYPFWMPILSLKTGDILMHSYDGFVLCDPKNGRVGKVSSFFQENKRIVRVLTMITAHPESYVESLVSLNSGTYVKKPRRQKSRTVSGDCNGLRGGAGVHLKLPVKSLLTCKCLCRIRTIISSCLLIASQILRLAFVFGTQQLNTKKYNIVIFISIPSILLEPGLVMIAKLEITRW
ncbi:F-box/kelch-repeat protein At3g23880-like [Papaver somniferum]|uniref:F-box/kelch-repeat protein At3g23880-like n=1 Tax=Papaver somniferum TaxID=3469 RepID=UPI000E6FD4B4|nr:F-box/kelch-repeat protein At3g23880-like [Papaver somniferum]